MTQMELSLAQAKWQGTETIQSQVLWLLLCISYLLGPIRLQDSVCFNKNVFRVLHCNLGNCCPTLHIKGIIISKLGLSRSRVTLQLPASHMTVPMGRLMPELTLGSYWRLFWGG